MKYNAFHYDMDGVLVNSEPLHVDVEKETCQHFGLDIDFEGWSAFKGRTAEDIFTYLHAEHMSKHPEGDIPSIDELIRHKTQTFIEKVWDGAIEPIEGSTELVKWTRKNSDVQSLVTSSNYRVKDAILTYFSLQRFFDVSVTANDIRIGKPHPGPYLKSLRLTGAKASESLVFEDSKNGIRSARCAKMAVMAITSDYHSREELGEVEPTYIVDGWSEAPTIIRAS